MWGKVLGFVDTIHPNHLWNNTEELFIDPLESGYSLWIHKNTYGNGTLAVPAPIHLLPRSTWPRGTNP